MVYDIEKMSLKSLDKLFKVAEYFKDKAEINGFPTPFTIEEKLHLDGLSDDDLNDIISGFLNEGILSDKERVNYKLVRFGDSDEDDVVETNDIIVHVNYDKLNNFYNNLEKRISELKRGISLGSQEYSLNKNIFLEEEHHILKFGDHLIKFRSGISFDVLRLIFSNPKEIHDYSVVAHNVDAEDDILNENIRYACEHINERILNSIGIKDFLLFDYRKAGNVKINEKYV